MTTVGQGQPYSLDYLTGRVEGQEAQLQALQVGQQQLREEMHTSLQQFREEMNSRMQEIREEIKELRSSQRQIIIATWTIGGGIFLALFGGFAALIFQGG